MIHFSASPSPHWFSQSASVNAIVEQIRKRLVKKEKTWLSIYVPSKTEVGCLTEKCNTLTE